MRVGQKLIAIDPCTDPVTETPLLTVGKEYEVIEVKSRYFYIIDDRGLRHSFGIPHHETYFQSITPESLEELGFEKNECTDEGEAFHEWLRKSGAVWIEVNSKLQVHIATSREYVLLPNCRNLTELKHLIRILGV